MKLRGHPASTESLHAWLLQLFCLNFSRALFCYARVSFDTNIDFTVLVAIRILLTGAAATRVLMVKRAMQTEEMLNCIVKSFGG
ncbi:hypothetical protein BDP67DRAFT_499706 [Colletotrichum lupini]|nr:hypothetical protein BDP67DRAFT_499706 [Colletotrichum lupini]